MKPILTLAAILAMGVAPVLASSQSSNSMNSGASSGMSSGMSSGSGASMSASQGDMGQRAQYYLKQMDKNADNSVSEEEHEDFAKNMFGQADKDGNGKLTLSEIQQQKQQEMQQMQQSMGGASSGTATTRSGS
jgi:hypothetical protein